MSRCFICDYSQSANSPYNDGLMINRTLSNNRVVYDKKLDKDICISCLEDAHQQQEYWTYIDGEAPEFNAYESSDEEVSTYAGCADKQGD